MLELAEAESHHLRVRRAGDGDPVEVMDGAGLLATGLLASAGRKWSVRIQSLRSTAQPSQLVLAVAAGDRDRFLLMVEKAAELGVTRITPLETRHSVAVGSRFRAASLAKARDRARDGCKQSGNPWLPQIDEPTPIADWTPPPGINWLIADREGAAPQLPLPAKVGWLIGPEGGFAASDLAALRDISPTPVNIGAHTLRFETAAILAAGLGRLGHNS